MTITDPEIVLGGDDPAPSAPPLSFNNGPPAAATAPPTSVPIAVGVAVPMSAVSPTSAAAATSAGAAIERSSNADGSLSVKLTTTTPRADGYREVKIEYFEVPANAAVTVGMALDAGEPPSSLYITRMEEQALPPGTAVVDSSPLPPTVSDANRPNVPAPAANVIQPDDSGGISGPRACAICCGVGCCVFIIFGIIGGSVSSSSGYSPPSYPYPSPPSYPSPSYPSPSFPSPSFPSPSFPSSPAPAINDFTFRGKGTCTNSNYSLYDFNGINDGTAEDSIEDCANACKEKYSSDETFSGINFQDGTFSKECDCIMAPHDGSDEKITTVFGFSDLFNKYCYSYDEAALPATTESKNSYVRTTKEQ